MSALHKDIAKIESARLGYEDHGIFTVELGCDGGSWGQGLPAYVIGGERGVEFVKAILRSVGVRYFDQLKGKTIFVLRESEYGPIVGIENLPTENGERLVFSEFWEEVPA